MSPAVSSLFVCEYDNGNFSENITNFISKKNMVTDDFEIRLMHVHVNQIGTKNLDFFMTAIT